MMKSGVLLPLNEKFSSVQVHNNSIPKTFGVNVWVFIAILVIIVAVIMFKEARKPKLVIPSLKPKKSGIAHLLFERRWHPYFTASIVGIIAIIAWPLSEATGRNSGLGITTPSANILQYLVSGDKSILNWGVFLVLGIFVGSFIAAKGSNEFRLRVPEVKTIVSSVCGGSLMGLGASLAGGCTIGNGLVSTAMMTWQGWIALAFMILGAWTATYFVFVRPRVKKQVVAKQAVTPASAN